jgi:hypothetical protein
MLFYTFFNHLESLPVRASVSERCRISEDQTHFDKTPGEASSIYLSSIVQNTARYQAVSRSIGFTSHLYHSLCGSYGTPYLSLHGEHNADNQSLLAVRDLRSAHSNVSFRLFWARLLVRFGGHMGRHFARHQTHNFGSALSREGDPTNHNHDRVTTSLLPFDRCRGWPAGSATSIISRSSGSSKLISVPPTVDPLSNQIQSVVRVHVLYVYVPKNFQCLSLVNVFLSSVSLKKEPLIAFWRTPRRF